MVLKLEKNKNGFEQLKGSTPRGRALWARVWEPSYTFDEDGVYSMTLIFDKSVKGVEEMIHQFEEQLNKAEQMAQELSSQNKNPRKRGQLPPLKDENHGNWVDKDGNETGEYFIKAKAKAAGVTKDGKAWTRNIEIYDSMGKPFDRAAATKIGNDSICKMSINVFPYATAIGYGISIRFDAVQVLDLKAYNEKTAAGFGFDVEEGGYSVEEDVAMPTASDADTADSEEAESGDY